MSIIKPFSAQLYVYPDEGVTSNSWFANLPYEEDFIIVLLRVGMTVLEATGLRGWGNEVAPIQRPRIDFLGRWIPGGRQTSSKVDFSSKYPYGRVEMGRSGVARVDLGSSSIAGSVEVSLPNKTEVVHTYESGISASHRKMRPLVGSLRSREGFNNDVRIVDLGNTGISRPFSGRWSRGMVVFWQFLVVLWDVIRGLIKLLLDKARRRVRHSQQEKPRFVVRGMLDQKEDGELIREQERRRKEMELYQNFLKGEEISDDEEDAIRDSPTLSSDDKGTSEDTDEGDSCEEWEAENEVISLFTDILRNGTTSRQMSSTSPSNSRNASSGEVVLAHLMHDSEGPSNSLTRRNWKSYRRRRHTAVNDDIRLLNETSSISMAYSKEMEERNDELQHVCVVCMLETRDIICWPCRYVYL